MSGLGGYSNRTQNAGNGAVGFAGILEKAAAAQKNADSGVAAGGSSKAGSGKTVNIDKTDKLYEQCLELETFLVKNLISSMRSTVQKSGLIDDDFAGKMYEDMLYDEYAKDFAKNANFGLAEQAYLELTGQRGQVIIR
ncbi:hypothetical protein AGMMS50293_30290 [Spirochaetia bacterium]|nr:hypothetical protein AGMMS50293_30290 [Spirochaetia bacterium]